MIKKNTYKLYGYTYVKYNTFHNVCAKFQCFCEGALSIAVEVKPQQLQQFLRSKIQTCMKTALKKIKGLKH